MTRTLARRLAATLLVVAVAVLLAPLLLPPFLDRVYYEGPRSGHFDGRRFFNPDGEFGTGGSRTRPGGATLARFLLGSDRVPWPKSIPVTPARPSARVEGQALRVTWIGHATVLAQTQGLNILTDPIWSTRASPFSFAGPERVRAPGIRFEDLPKIDLVLVSHAHYDHMDLPTLKRLWERDRPLIVTSLGNDRIMAGAGVEAVALDWGGRVPVRPGVEVVVEQVHHWMSRWFGDRNRALWSGFTVTLPGGNLFFGGDTGPGDMGWVDAAAGRGPVRLAILPIGAFRPRELMSGNHIGPAEAVEVYRRMGAAHALGMHWGTYQLSSEGVDEPREGLERALARRGIDRGRFRALEAGEAWEVP